MNDHTLTKEDVAKMRANAMWLHESPTIPAYKPYEPVDVHVPSFRSAKSRVGHVLRVAKIIADYHPGTSFATVPWKRGDNGRFGTSWR